MRVWAAHALCNHPCGVACSTRACRRTAPRAVASAAFFLLPLSASSPNGTTVILAAASVTLLFWTVPTTVLGKGARAGGIVLSVPSEPPPRR